MNAFSRLSASAVVAWVVWAPLVAGAQTAPGVLVDVGPTPWFGHPSIRQQLKLEDAQYNSLNRSYTQSWTRYNQEVTKLAADLKEEQRQQRVREYQANFHNEFAKSRDEVLADEALRQRYNQLHWQYQSYGAFNDPRVQERLKLTEEQRQAFNRYYGDWNKEYGTYRREYATDRQGVTKRYNESWKEARERINATLTPQQRKTWNEMIGDPYEFQPDVYFGSDRQPTPRNP